MKELTIEQKAQRYDEAIERANAAHKDEDRHLKAALERIFPELTESEDEKVKKRIIQALHGDVLDLDEISKCTAWVEKQGRVKESSIFQHEIETCKENNDSLISEDESIRKILMHIVKGACSKYGIKYQGDKIGEEKLLDWLEKQGEPMEINPTEFDTKLQALIGKFDSLPKEELIGSLSFWLNVVQNDGTYKPDEEKQNEQKSDNKPKFHEGDWVVFNNRYDSVYQVERIENYEYTLRHFLGGSMPLLFSHEDMIRAWTIKDARNGDVLATDDWVFIFEKFNTDGKPVCYCHYDIELGFATNVNTYISTDSTIKPATKEQRDTLFDEMGKAGYWWDAAKKELNKIKPKFKVGDLVMVSTAVGDRVVQIASVGYLKDGHPSYFTTEGRWFDNRIKARLLTDKDMETITLPESRVIKSWSWSEEDELNLNQAIYVCHQNGYDGVEKWLKSLKSQKQWKPLGKHLEALAMAINDEPLDISVRDDLYDLFEQLKQL